jgi:hypothetical protein
MNVPGMCPYSIWKPFGEKERKYGHSHIQTKEQTGTQRELTMDFMYQIMDVLLIKYAVWDSN